MRGHAIQESVHHRDVRDGCSCDVDQFRYQLMSLHQCCLFLMDENGLKRSSKNRFIGLNHTLENHCKVHCLCNFTSVHCFSSSFIRLSFLFRKYSSLD